MEKNALTKIDLSPLVRCTKLQQIRIDEDVELLIDKIHSTNSLPPALQRLQNKLTWVDGVPEMVIVPSSPPQVKNILQDIPPQVDTRINKLQKLSSTCESLDLDELREILDFQVTDSLKKWLLRDALDKISFRLSGKTIYFNQPETRLNNRISFFCQIDSENHPSTDNAYQCSSCNRFVCASCFEDSVQVGIISCPFCNGELLRFQ